MWISFTLQYLIFKFLNMFVWAIENSLTSTLDYMHAIMSTFKTELIKLHNKISYDMISGNLKPIKVAKIQGKYC